MPASEVTEQLLSQLVATKTNADFLIRMEIFLRQFKQNIKIIIYINDKQRRIEDLDISAYDLYILYFAQNETFVQIGIGTKIEPYEYSPTLETLPFL